MSRRTKADTVPTSSPSRTAFVRTVELGTEASLLFQPSRSTPHSNFQVLLPDPTPRAGRAGSRRELGFVALLALFCFIVLHFSKVNCFEVSSLHERAADVIPQEAP